MWQQTQTQLHEILTWLAEQTAWGGDGTVGYLQVEDYNT